MAIHSLVIRTTSVATGEVVDETSDFAEAAVYDYFETVMICADPGETVTAIDTATGRVLQTQNTRPLPTAEEAGA
jgi:hypothetical protein